MWNTEKCLNSDSGPLANMSRWPAGLMLYPAASPCTAREPQQTCLDIPWLTWPIILSHVPNTIGRVGGIFTCSFLGQLQPKSDWKRGPKPKAEKASTALEQLKNPRTANATSNLIGATRLEGQLFDDVVLSQRGNPSKDRGTDNDKDMGNWQRPPYSPPKEIKTNMAKSGEPHRTNLRFWLDKLIKIAHIVVNGYEKLLWIFECTWKVLLFSELTWLSSMQINFWYCIFSQYQKFDEKLNFQQIFWSSCTHHMLKWPS